jgi:Pro-kumamolisin, activation domain
MPLKMKIARGIFLFLFALSASILTAQAQADARTTLHGHVLEIIKHLRSNGRLPDNQEMQLAIGLPLRNTNELAVLLQQLYEPGSPNFRHYLTAEEFAQRFGPTEEQYQAVRAFAETNGLRVTRTHSNRLLLDVAGPVANVEKTFHITLRTYKHPTEARNFFAPDTEPSVKSGLAVLDVSGLNNYVLPHPRSHHVSTESASPKSGSGTGGAYMGNDFRAAYVPGTTLTGAGQVAGVFEFDGFYANDIKAYEKSNNLPNVTLQTVLLDGFNGIPTKGSLSGNSEVALDIDMIIAMAPGISKVIIYEAGPNGLQNDILNQMATDDKAEELGCSWGWGGGPSATTDNIFQEMIAQGQSFFNASGDSDAFPPGTLDSPNSYNAPSSSPYITQVGGTTLTTTGPGGAWSSETVWNWGGGVGSSGGVSSYYTIPSWQQGINMTANHGSTNNRNIPDVALTADNIFIFDDNGKKDTLGGTSASAQLWAGLMALVNERAAASGNPPVGFVNPAIYAIGNSANYSACFHDITTGNNTWKRDTTNFFAVAGYDLCTGWGTPAGVNLINELAPGPDIVTTGYLVGSGGIGNPTNGAVAADGTVTVNFALQNIGNVNTTNLVVTLLETNGVVSPDGPQTYGALTAGGNAVTLPFTFTASGVCGSNLSAVFQLQDGAANLGSISQAIPLGLQIKIFSENFDEVAAPALPAGWMTTNSGAQARWATSTKLSDTAPNAAFTAGAKTTGFNELVSPPFQVTLDNAQLTFRQNYNLQSGYDGGVLEIKIGSNAFTDIITAGGSFVKGGYVKTISTKRKNPLAGRSAWTGNSGGFVTTIINLPASAIGQTVQLKWRCGTDEMTSSVGWHVDSISVTGLDCDADEISPSVVQNVPNKPAASQTSSVSSQSQSTAITGGNSANFLEAIKVPPQLTAHALPTGGQFRFTFNTVTNVNYAVQYSTTLTQWQTLTNVSGTGGPVTVIDANTTGDQQRFYRVVVSQQ